MALALPVLRMERLAVVMPILSASSLDFIFRLASMTSRLTIIMVPSLNGQLIFFGDLNPSFQNLAKDPDNWDSKEKSCVKGQLEGEGKEISIAIGLKCTRHKGQDQEDLPSSVAKINVGVRKDLFLIEILEEAANSEEKKNINSA